MTNLMIQIDEYIDTAETKLQGPLHVTKVPDTLVDQLKERFLDLFAQCGLVAEVAKQMGISPGTVYQWRRKDSVFADEWDRIRREELLAIVEDKAFEKVMKEDSKSDGLMMFLMKSWKRDVYDEKFVEAEKEKKNFRVTIEDARELAKNQVLELEVSNDSSGLYEFKKAEDEKKG